MTTTTSTLRASQSPRSHHRGGPSPLIPAVAFAVLTVAATALGASAPGPTAAAGAVAAYAAAHRELLGGQATLLFASAVPLVIWAAAVRQDLARRGVRSAGPLIGFGGGLLAAASLALSGLCTWTNAAVADPAAPALAGMLRTLGFAAGAVGFVAPLGLLLTGLAVPMLVRRVVPRWLGWTGVVVGAVGMVSTLALLTPALDVLLPVGRFGGMLWILAACVGLGLGRGEAR